MKGTIEVTGTAEDHAIPDRALIEVTTHATGPSSATAYRAAASGAASVDAVLERHAAAIDRTQVREVSVRETTVYRDGQHVRTGWAASRDARVDVVDFTALIALVADLAEAGATIHGPTWRIDATNDVHDCVRAAAAADARRRAEAYASGLGVGVGAVRSVTEPGSYRFSEDHDALVLESRSMEPPGAIGIEAAELRVAASVTVEFTLASA